MKTLLIFITEKDITSVHVGEVKGETEQEIVENLWTEILVGFLLQNK